MDEKDVKVLKPICMGLKIPLQEPVEVTVQDKVIRENANTHRIVEFRTESSFVALSNLPEFGQLKVLFTYRVNKFAIISKFERWKMEDGIIHIQDTTTTSRVAAHLDSLSTPLVIALPPDKDTREMWILNYH